MITATEKIWRNGKFINWNDATIHVLAHVTSYGSSVFEGIRCYSTPNGPMIFRLRDHIRRLHDSAKIYRMEIGHSIDEISAASVELVRVNKLDSCYIRPLVIRGYGGMGVYAKDCPIETYLACWEWGKYMGPEALENGVDVCVSSWTRLAPNTLPAMSKAGANYMNSQLIRMESSINGYAEGIALDAAGYVSEGSGENIFLVRDGKLFTPPLGASVLPGITRDSVITLAHSDEVFFTGTAAELTPIRSVDRIQVGAGKRGPVTEKIQKEFFAIMDGKKPDAHGWLTPVPQPVASR